MNDFEFLNEKVDVEKNLSEMEGWLEKNGFEYVYCHGTYCDVDLWLKGDIEVTYGEYNSLSIKGSKGISINGIQSLDHLLKAIDFLKKI